VSALTAGFRRVRVGVLLEASRTFRPALRGQRGALVAALVLALGATAIELLKPWPLKVLFDEVLLVEAGGGRLLAPSAVLVAGIAVTVVVLALLGATLTARATIIAAEVGRKLTTRARRQVFEHLHRLGMPFHTTSRRGDLLIRLMGDVNLLRDGLVTSWLALAERGALFLGMAVVLFIVDPWVALAAMLPLPLLAVGLRRSSRELRQTTRKQRRKEGDAAAFAMESLRQIRVVKSHAREGETARQFAERTGSGERAAVKAARIAAHMGRLTEVMTGIGLALVLYVGARRVLSGAMSPGDLIVAIAYARLLFKPLRGMSREGGRLAKASSGAERLLEVLREQPEAAGVGLPAPSLAGDLDLRGVTCRYEGREAAVASLTLHVRPGDFTVINGASGAGKSTILNLMLRLVPPDGGSILVDGRPQEAYELHAYRRCFAYVPQDIELFGGTIRENILYGRPDATDEDVRAAAHLAQLDDVLDAMPDGLNTVLGEDGSRLSGGQARRVMVARAALSRASVLLLDEPLGGLDPEARSLVAAAVRASAAGRTTLVVNHGSSEEFDPDVVVTMAHGRVLGVAYRRSGSSAPPPRRPDPGSSIEAPRLGMAEGGGTR
jgi:ATP-binding cassette, subfamily B, bacterial